VPAACTCSFPVNSPTTRGSGRVMSCTRISSMWHTASVHKGPPYGYLILTPNTRSQSSLQSRFANFTSLLLLYILPLALYIYTSSFCSQVVRNKIIRLRYHTSSSSSILGPLLVWFAV
jgi:hypothetical protein